MNFKLLRLCFLSWVCIAVLLGFSCGTDDESDKSDSSGKDKVPPIKYTNKIEAVAAGDSVIRYINGYWIHEEGVPSDAAPWYSVIFPQRTEGWAGGSGRVFHYQNNTWTAEPPLNVPGSMPIHRLVAALDGTIWAIGNAGAENGGRIMQRTLEGPWSTMDLDAYFGKSSIAKDIVALPTGGVGILIQVEQSAIYYKLEGGSATTVPLYNFDPANWYTLSAISLTADGRLLVGGRLNQGINKTGFVWLLDDAGVLQPMTLPATSCPLTDVTRFTAVGTRNYMIGLCNHSTIYYLDSGQWTEMELPGNKGNGWRINDFGFMDWSTGWAVGYSDTDNQPLLLLLDTNWQLVQPLSDDAGSGKSFYGVAVWKSEGTPISDDDTADDDTVSDDTAGDDTLSDDTLADDTV